jgi:uncharacterized protein with PIN domain
MIPPNLKGFILLLQNLKESMVSEQQNLNQQLQQEKLSLASEKSRLETLARLHDATSPDISRVMEAFIPRYTVNIYLG